ncbi:MAG: Ig-like domain-containing protein [archaeon]
MVHKRFIKKGGKIYGPYFYKSVRDKNGKVRNIYLGSDIKESSGNDLRNKLSKSNERDFIKNNSYISILVVLLVLIGLYFVLSALSFFSPSYTGFEVAESDEVMLNDQKEIKDVVVKDKFGNVLDKKIDIEGEDYKIDISSFDKKFKLEIKTKNLPDNIDTYIGEINDNRIKSEVVAIKDSIDIDSATVTLQKKKQVDYIMYCPGFDFDNLYCDEWQITDIPFTSIGDTITFTVTHFTAYAGGGGNNSNLTIWDDTETNLRYTLGSGGGESNLFFYANYTNSTSGQVIDALYNCSIRFNSSGSWSDPINMTYKSINSRYEYNRTFTVKGNYLFNITCNDDDFDMLTALDNFTISNTWPDINPKPLPSITCNEDTMCYYNFSENVTDPDTNDVLVYSRDANTFFSCFAMNTATGIINFTCYSDNNSITGYSMTLLVTDSGDGSDSVFQLYTIVAVNDMPNMTAIGTLNAYEDTLFTYDVVTSDEEDGNENSGNLTYTDNTTLFNITSNTGIISFTPNQNQVGTYLINISVNDTRNGLDYEIVTLIISGTGDTPVFDYVCNNERNATEDVNFNCTVNATDIDPNDVLTFNTNVSWFKINTTGWVNFTPTNSQVGYHFINITVNDSYNMLNYTIIQFNVSNVNDAPILSTIGNLTLYSSVFINLTINASDDDISTMVNDSLYFWSNDTYLFNITKVNNWSASLSFMPSNLISGIYWFNISVNDSNNAMDSEIINISILLNYPPNITAYVNNNATEGFEFYLNLSLNVSDNDNDIIYFYDNISIFEINRTTGIINFTLNDSFVNQYWVNITVMDEHGANNSQVLNFTIYNINDNPYFKTLNGNISAFEDTVFYLNLSSNVSDDDLYIPSNNIFGINETLTFSVNVTFFNITTLTGIINFTPTNNSVGMHWINISVNDSNNALVSRIVNFTVVGVNDAPVLSYIGNLTATEGSPFSYDANATDEEDGNEYSGKLTYQINVSFISINITSGIFNFTPNSTHANVGFYWINISVNDSNNVLDYEIFNITINNINNAPAIITKTPSGNVSMVENTSKNFIITISDADNGDIITSDWTLDGKINETDSGTISGTIQHTFTYNANWTDSGYHNLTVFVYDSSNVTYYTWNITVNNSNAPPSFEGTIENITWNEDTTYSNLDLDTYLRDVDGQNTLNISYVQMNTSYSAINNSYITVTINNNTNVVSLVPQADWYGNETIYFSANDSQYRIVSNNITLIVTNVDEAAPQSSPAGGGGSSSTSTTTKIASLDIILPQSVKMYPVDEVNVPVILKNNGAVVLNSISITAESEDSVFDLTLDKNWIDSLTILGEETINLDIISPELKPGGYKIHVNASVASPALTESAELYIEIQERNVTRFKELLNMINFTKDLFEQNPECLELNELISKAEEKLTLKQYDEGLKIINDANEACKNILAKEKKTIEVTRPRSFYEKWWLYPLVVFGLLIIFYMIKYYIKRKKFRRR